MRIAEVTGSTISTIKSPRVANTKIMICQPTDVSGSHPVGNPYAAIDLVDAGVGDLVLTCHGSAARQTYLTKDTPVDAVIIGVLDHLELDGDLVYRKGA